MAPVLNVAWEITNLQVQADTTLQHIDEALDRGDRRAFRMWSMKHRSLSVRLSSLLVKIATTEAR